MTFKEFYNEASNARNTSEAVKAHKDRKTMNDIIAMYKSLPTDKRELVRTIINTHEGKIIDVEVE